MVSKTLKELASKHSDGSVEFSSEKEPEYMAIIHVGGKRKKMSVVIPKERLAGKKDPFEIFKLATEEGSIILRGEKYAKEISEICEGKCRVWLPDSKNTVVYKSIFDYFDEKIVKGKHYFVAEIGIEGV